MALCHRQTKNEKITKKDIHIFSPKFNDELYNKIKLLSYWNLNKSLYPNLARIAKRVLAILTTNASVERSFSHNDNTVTNR